ncbi:hypothetical protein ACGFYP_02755 [Streptomyces sp. NPDC048370]|uniref:hypothetical protein n=1 Tax=Streptomyces sp. NPDC048370 TaxID=3365540 RepID=UPI003718219E
MGLRGSAHIDFIVTEDGDAYVLEVNSTPGMSRGSTFAVGAATVGLTHTDVVRVMLHEALARPPYDIPPAHSRVLQHHGDAEGCRLPVGASHCAARPRCPPVPTAHRPR